MSVFVVAPVHLVAALCLPPTPLRAASARWIRPSIVPVKLERGASGISDDRQLWQRRTSDDVSMSAGRVVAAAAGAFGFLAIVRGRIRTAWGGGYIVDGLPIRVDQSNVPNAGRGVFATAAIGSGEPLGAYPGRYLSRDAFAAKKRSAPCFEAYCFGLEVGNLDPTDENGKLLEPLPRLQWRLPFKRRIGSVPTTLALINEPPPSGSDVNVVAWRSERGRSLVLLAGRDIEAGEELYLDYGAEYDRSGYPQLPGGVALSLAKSR